MTETPNVDEELDLQGEVCPYTFVKSKLALEQMEAGEVLRLIVTNPESADNVPRSLKNEGYTVLDISQLGDQRWAILVKKA
jgi:TusA-related sulfurtransferase